VVDLTIAIAGVGFAVLLSGPGWAGPESGVLAVVAGLPLAFLRRRPAAVTAFLAGVLVVCNVAGWFGGNAVQLLMTVALVAVGRSSGRRATAAATVLAGIANLTKLAAAAEVPHLWSWAVPVAFTVVPVVIGRLASSRHPGRGIIEPGDVVLGVTGAMVSVLQTWGHSGAWQSTPLSGVLPVAGLGLLAARRFPRSVLAVECAVAVTLRITDPPAAVGMSLLVCTALGVVASRLAVRWVVLGTAVTWPVVTAAIGGLPAGYPFEIALLLGALPTLLAVVVGRYLALRRDLERRRAAAIAAEARASERELIAREVHDVVAHHIGAIVLMAGAASMAARSTGTGPPGPDPPGPDPLGRALTDIRTTAQDALTDLRAVLDVLRGPGVVGPGDLGEAIEDVVARVAAAGVDVVAEVDPAAARAPLLVRAAALRIVQESLTNVLKHAGAGASASVAVEMVAVGMAADRLDVRVSDRPTSSSTWRPPRSGSGVHGMRERARAVGGELRAGPLDGGGWLVSARLPVTGGDRR
jgi:signal transduction histidine kinase